MNYSHNKTLMEQLKQQTASLHEELQALAYFRAITSQSSKASSSPLPVESYVAHLRTLSVIHATLERVLSQSDHPVLAAVWNNDMAKIDLLQKDLHFFEPRAVADIKETVDVALSIAENISLCSAERPVALLGFLYVLEGSALGAQVLAADVAHAYALENNEGLAYLTSYGEQLRPRWLRFTRQMNALQLEQDERQLIIQTAVDFFVNIKALFSSLYPFDARSMIYHVTALNPEAGRHPVPSDPRVLQAAIKAADLCWQRFPYFERRYGERGLRFAHSDGAWLVTLCRFDQSRVNQQVNWLSRVLATRGMPTILLQLKLELLFEQLSEAVPEDTAIYEKLSKAALQLAAARQQQLDDSQLYQLNEEFNNAMAPLSARQDYNSGMLLACAVADEHNGLTGTLDNLQQWFTDKSQYSGAAVAIIQATVLKAKAYIGGH